MKYDVLLTVSWIAAAGTLVVAARKNALVVEPSTAWDGNDGPWSSFAFQIGSGLDTQNVRLLPSTNLPETYLIQGSGCGDPNNTTVNTQYPILGKPCPESRGVLYDHNKSSTYNNWTIYNIANYSAVNNYNISELKAQFGREDVHFGWQKTSGDGKYAVVKQSIIGEITDNSFFWVGVFGLDPRPTNLSELYGMNNPQKSVLDKLKESSHIPSRSWAYTAGSFGSGSYGSLVLGGYDAARIKRNKVTFPFEYDVERAHTVVLQDIYTTLQPESPPVALNKLHNPNNDTYHNLYVIESNRPYLFLPKDVCEEIASHVGAQYDRVSRHYLLPDWSYQALRMKNTSLTFRIAPRRSSQSVNITLPFTSLALRLDYPLRPVNNISWYVPIRSATNNLQLALGRAFLQNAVLVSDYERQTYSVHEAVTAPPGFNSNIRPIIMNRRETLDSWKGTLSNAEIAGISIGSVTLTSLIMIVIFCLCSRRQNKVETQKNHQEEILRMNAASSSATEGLYSNPFTLFNGTPNEADSVATGEIGSNSSAPPAELGTHTAATELPDSSGTGELVGFFNEAELDGLDTSRLVFEVEGSPVATEILKDEQGRRDRIPRAAPPARHVAADPIVLRIPEAGGRFRPRDVRSVARNRLQLVNGGLVAPTSPEQLRSANTVPASPIPQTPLEYYGWAHDAHHHCGMEGHRER